MHNFKDHELSSSKRRIWAKTFIVLTVTFILLINIIGLIIGSIIYEEASLLPSYSPRQPAVQQLQ